MGIPAVSAKTSLGAAAQDARFRDPAWTSNRHLRALRDTYLMATRAATQAVDALPLSPGDLRAARFVLDLATGALAPPNLLLTNPAVLRKAVRTRGRSLVQGLTNLLTDVRHNGGLPSPVDRGAFTVGRDLATTRGRVVFRNHIMELIQYEPTTATVHTVPLLYSPPWVNKFYVVDLTSERSMVRWAVDHGHTVFVISYRNPDSSLRHIGYDDYLRESLVPALGVVRDITDTDEVNLSGACLGGLIGLMLAAWLDDDHSLPRLRSITALNTLVDFNDIAEVATTGATGWLLRGPALRFVEALSTAQGFAGGRQLEAFFRLLRSEELIWSRMRAHWLMGEPLPAYDILYWSCDSLNVPHRAQQYLLRDLCVENAFAAGTAELAGRRLRLDHVTQDVFLVAALDDHIVPWTSAYRTVRLLPGDVRFHLTTGGHVGLAAPGSGTSYWTGGRDDVAGAPEWLAGATKNHDSWWPTWMRWLTERAGPRRTPPPLGSDRYPPMERAPGPYVLT
ncbi:Poly-hydroxyalkanoic acid synthase [Saccharothrix espanaensis DSM 44229]|uniref:Poly-hydroxyalkanoic acid synthase n=1 Tax=Saccharothrix espanaensis (strain ATCC 51144 / DSM 44229 / JCM 9112 / NBRC 15066 / NRRL 15764) TaxID=1179773 RepID=K0JZG5_SACES|nr:alpha/beta fold hydrolase [Saccharothrix espanaensis]CCH30667.1 Poly-hydroxyalkanoic acid synthase [Saccharothrix espanaensis DSM 44229]